MRVKIFLSIAVDAIWTWIIGGVFAVIGVVVFIFPNLGVNIPFLVPGASRHA